MGSAAARVGDLTAHGGKPLSPGTGATNVLIAGKAAWRATVDAHVCPLSDGPKPHGGGVVAKGSSSVWIGGFPAVRQGDKIIEAGPPNAITSGATSVLIGG